MRFKDVDFCDLTGKKKQNFTETYAIIHETIFNQVKATGRIIIYTYIKCKSFKVFKNHHQLEMISFKEEVERGLINQSVQFINRTKHKTVSQRLIKLSPNKG